MQEQTDPTPPRPVPGPPPTPPSADWQQRPQETDPCAGVEEAVAGLDELETLPLAEHVERFDAVHTELTVALSSIDRV